MADKVKYLPYTHACLIQVVLTWSMSTRWASTSLLASDMPAPSACFPLVVGNVQSSSGANSRRSDPSPRSYAYPPVSCSTRHHTIRSNPVVSYRIGDVSSFRRYPTFVGFHVVTALSHTERVSRGYRSCLCVCPSRAAPQYPDIRRDCVRTRHFRVVQDKLTGVAG